MSGDIFDGLTHHLVTVHDGDHTTTYIDGEAVTA